MKWILIGAALVAFSLHAMSKMVEHLPSAPPDTADHAPDLFRQNDQVYSSHVEFLYWAVAEGGLDYALKMEHAAWGPGPSYAQGNFETARYGLDPGFRIALQYFRAPHYWEIKWQYTRMTNRGKTQAYQPGGNLFLTGTWPQISPNPLAKAASRLHFNYNVFDWIIDRVFFPNPHLRLRITGGGAVAWMDQYWHVRYTDTESNTTSIDTRWHFVGAGLKAGTIFDWYWTGNLYMTGSNSFGLLMGSYSNRAKQTTTYQDDDGDNPAIPVRDAFYSDVRPTATAQILLGPSWQRNFKRNRVEVFAGFEMNFWFNLQEIYRSTANTSELAKETQINAALLALYGFTTRLSMDF